MYENSLEKKSVLEISNKIEKKLSAKVLNSD